MQLKPDTDMINIAKAHTIIITRRLLWLYTTIGFYELEFFYKISTLRF